jgi:hypothetical protein
MGTNACYEKRCQCHCHYFQPFTGWSAETVLRNPQTPNYPTLLSPWVEIGYEVCFQFVATWSAIAADSEDQRALGSHLAIVLMAKVRGNKMK